MKKQFNKLYSKYKNLVLLSSTALISSACTDIIKNTQTESVRRSDANVYAGTNQGLIYPDNIIAMKGKYTTSTNFSGFLEPQFITDNPALHSNCEIKQYFPDIFNPNASNLKKSVTEDECIAVLNDDNASTTLLQNQNESWVYNKNSDEFYQVNTFYHLNTMLNRFLDTMSFVHKSVHLDANQLAVPPATKWNFLDTGSILIQDKGIQKTLKAYSKCYLEYNAYFSPAEDILCFGYDTSGFRMVQDPSIIYHEMGHVFVKAMMNQRNVTKGIDPGTSLPFSSAHDYESDLGEIYYDEAGAINEGIADYFAYYMNNRTSFGEFAFYKLKTLSEDENGDSPMTRYRPLSENEEEHSIDLAEVSGQRLSYPQHVHYDPANPLVPVEDVHYASGTVSHYLVALTKEFKNRCSFDNSDKNYIHKRTTDYIVLLLSETLAEIGDLTAKGSDYFSEYTYPSNNGLVNLFFTNLNPDESYLWTQVVNPPNFRRFFRVFGKNIIHHISNNLCPEFSVDSSEKLLDDYGLLLFRSYEDRGNGIDLDTNALTYYSAYNNRYIFNNRYLNSIPLNTAVNENNRKQSVLISKDFVKLDDEAVAFVIDGQNDMKNILTNLTFQGKRVSPTEGIAGTEYNNGNVKISPGEVVAVSLNLYNNSNSPMGGVQFLANDWDHMKLTSTSNTYTNKMSNKTGLSSGDITGGIATHVPCMVDGFPSSSEGGVTDTSTSTPGNCATISKTNKKLDKSETDGIDKIFPKYELDAPQPICLVQYSDENETKWVSQDFFRNYSIGLEDSDCLNNPSKSGDDFNPNECLMRFLPGASQAVLGKIDPQKTWSETYQANKDGFAFDSGHLVVMEVNKWIEPGTKFNCRFRVRFSNCSDCFDNIPAGASAGDIKDYSDYEYIGHEPYKVINLQFTVLD